MPLGAARFGFQGEKKLDVSYYHPFKDALSSILLLFLAYFVFNEKLKTNRIIGALLITVGIFVMH